jgi:hypothetical protein
MKTTTLIATFVAAATLVFVQPLFAQTDDGFAAETSDESSMAPNFEEPWEDSTPSYGGPVLAPAPEEPAAPESAPMLGGYSSERSAGPWMEPPESPFAQPFVNPSISATNPLPPVGQPYGGFHSPAGGFRR